jgi:hypothetical protein
LEFLKLPLRRLRLSATRQEAEDHLIDCVIALERLLAPDNSKAETTYRFVLRGAALLPPDFGSSEKRKELMDKLYKERSNTVHGKIPKDMNELNVKAERVLRQIILWYLKKGITTGKDANEIVKKIDLSFIDAGQKWQI